MPRKTHNQMFVFTIIWKSAILHVRFFSTHIAHRHKELSFDKTVMELLRRVAVWKKVKRNENFFGVFATKASYTHSVDTTKTHLAEKVPKMSDTLIQWMTQEKHKRSVNSKLHKVNRNFTKSNGHNKTDQRPVVWEWIQRQQVTKSMLINMKVNTFMFMYFHVTLKTA